MTDAHPAGNGGNERDPMNDVDPDAVEFGGDDSPEELQALEFESGVSQDGKDIYPDGATDDAADHGVRVLTARPARGRGRNGTGMRKRLVGALVLLIGLLGMGGAYSLFASSSSAAGENNGDAAAGRQLFSNSCITCHGANLDGVKGRGPSLLGVGGAATYFQVSTGRMPLVGQGAEADRKTAMFTQDQIDDLVAYVQSIGGGPNVPTGDLRDNQNLAEGGELFRLNCASCHNFAGKGAPLSAGKVAPSLNEANDLQIYTAMLSGPENMPVFSENQLTPDQKRQIIAYIQTLKASKDPGGAGLDRVGPVSEGLVIWVVGIGAMMAIILWIGRKA